MGRERVYCGRGGSKGLSTYAKIAGNPIDQEKKNEFTLIWKHPFWGSLSKIYIQILHCILRGTEGLYSEGKLSFFAGDLQIWLLGRKVGNVTWRKWCKWHVPTPSWFIFGKALWKNSFPFRYALHYTFFHFGQYNFCCQRVVLTLSEWSILSWECHLWILLYGKWT